MATKGTLDSEPELSCKDAKAWDTWLGKHHATSGAVRLVLAKKGSGVTTVTYAEAVEVALTWGWIDGMAKRRDEATWTQRFTRRTAKSPWSKINREKATALIAAKKMNPPGLAEIERAKADGRWDRAYDSPSVAKVPEDLQAALDGNKKAKTFFAGLDGTNRYAILHRLHAATKPETRARRLALFVAMLERGEVIHPDRARKTKVTKAAPQPRSKAQVKPKQARRRAP